MVISVILIIVGFALLIKGADFLVDGASNVAKKFHIPEIIIGLTIVSIGTSMPELFVSTTSIINGSSDMSIGNIIGSNVCNLLLILGLSAIIRPIEFKRETRLIENPMCFAITLIFAFVCNTSGMVSKNEALVLLVLFVIFIAYTIIMGIKGEKFDEKDAGVEINNKTSKPISITKSIICIIIGIVALKYGGDLTVDNATKIARMFNVSEKIIGLTILAIGTSLPELVTSVTAATKGNSDIAIGNIIGSNIFNVLFIMGVSAIISPIQYNFTYNVQLVILALASIVLALFPIIPPKNKMSRTNGIVYFLMYCIYIGILFIV